MTKASIAINAAEAAVATRDATATGLHRASKTTRGWFFADLFHRKVSESEVSASDVRFHPPLWLVVDVRCQTLHFRDWFRRRAISSHAGGQKQAGGCSSRIKVSSFRKIFLKKAKNCIATIDEDANVGIVTTEAATPKTAGEPGYLNRLFTNKESLVAEQSEPVIAGTAVAAAVCEEFVVVIGTTTRSRYAFNPDCVGCCSMPMIHIPDHSVASSDYHDSITVESIAVEENPILEEIEETVPFIPQEIEHDSFSTVDLGECKTKESLAAGPQARDILTTTMDGNADQENNEGFVETAQRVSFIAPRTPSYGLSVVTNTVCGVLGSIGERASKIVQQQLTAARQQTETNFQGPVGQEP
ncbi:hypothetical protein V1520DRAFT_135617 [Lipomyces starkeyi]|uniref:Uncharacterized protein n=1 Tax=Lipomyces starkeyi NRRL Y-11557 TaxID=675824 RepID=A0A1E3PZ39_LIPST|nr:hypothetical protein LIPSTDRAFT_170420 [Lipomyces starkeyi NRRL Y-11557]